MKERKPEGTWYTYEKRKFRADICGRAGSTLHNENANGMEMSVTDYGATLVSLLAEDKNGEK